MATTSEPGPDLDAAAEHAPADATLAKTYRLVAELFVNPEMADRSTLAATARRDVLPAVAEDVDDDTASRLRSFLDEYESMPIEEFVVTHELSPACPLYVGHYAFDEPETCRDVADADRNQYMVELNAIYEHYGFELEDELPDFLPAMVEFCWLTLPDRGDELRAEFQRKLLAILPALRERFESEGTPYRLVLEVLDRLLRVDLAGEPRADLELPDVEDMEGLSLADGRLEASGGAH